jgi:hypothetical protein
MNKNIILVLGAVCFILVFSVMILGIGLYQQSTSNEPTTNGKSGIVELKFNEKISIGDIELYFYDIKDSRCPLDVTCVWEGEVNVMIQVQNQTDKISGNFTPGFTLSFTSYNITLVDVLPHPTSTEKPDYVVILEITKLTEP